MRKAAIFAATIMVTGLVSAPLFAQDAKQPCAEPVTPSGILAPWTHPVPATAAAEAGQSDAARIEAGSAVRLSLHPASDVRYVVAPGKPGGSVSYGGLAGLDIPEAGRYRVALGSPGWADIVSNGAAIASVAHGHGPECTGIRKIVDFDLQAGSHILQIAANGEPETNVLVVPVRQ